MDSQELLFELFKAMFLNDTGKEFTDQIEEREAWVIIQDGGMNIGKRALLLQALVDEYVCIQKYKR